ncbi:unnamed protein product [Sphagnum balticum]
MELLGGVEESAQAVPSGALLYLPNQLLFKGYSWLGIHRQPNRTGGGIESLALRGSSCDYGWCCSCGSSCRFSLKSNYYVHSETRPLQELL